MEVCFRFICKPSRSIEAVNQITYRGDIRHRSPRFAFSHAGPLNEEEGAKENRVGVS